jgi:hypothetical protein
VDLLSQQHDSIDDLAILSSAMIQAAEQANMEELMSLLNQRELVIGALLTGESLTSDQAYRLSEVTKSDAVLAEMIEVEQQKISQDLIDIYASRRGHKAYRKAA